MLNIVRKPFKSNGTFYPAGTIIKDPAGISLLKTKIKDKWIVQVDEHGITSLDEFFIVKKGVSEKFLKGQQEYVGKVLRLASKFDIDTTDKELAEVVEEVRVAQAEAKANQAE